MSWASGPRTHSPDRGPVHVGDGPLPWGHLPLVPGAALPHTGPTIVAWLRATVGPTVDQRSRSVEPVRVFVVDDHDVVRTGIAHTLTTPEFALVGARSSARDTLGDLRQGARTDVMTVDVTLPDASGLELVHRVRVLRPEVKCLLFTATRNPRLELAAVISGAAGLLTKDATPDRLRDAVHRTALGEQLSTIPDILQNADPPLDADRLQTLTVQEGRVLGLVVHGLTNPQIAQVTGLADTTVRNIVSRLLAKTGLSNRTHLASYVLGAVSLVGGVSDRLTGAPFRLVR